jgi:N-acetylglucosaminyldiphosphoundecaprenol N-acetyl-beta-D-mannosaminyltransferase
MSAEQVVKAHVTTNTYPIFDTRVDALTIEDLHARIAESIRSGSRRIFTSHNLHSLYLHGCDDKLRTFYQLADYIRIDGMAVVLLGRLLGLPLERRHRVTWVDWLPLFMAEAAKGAWRVFYLGSKPGVADRAAAVLRARWPDLHLATAHGYFDPQSNSRECLAVVNAINAFHPHILMVGMGMPLQQHWVLDNYERLAVNVITTSGAALDYVAGEISTPPRWSGQLGLEWVFRLAAEPRRLAGRYMVEPWYILPLLAKHLVGRRRSRLHRIRVKSE